MPNVYLKSNVSTKDDLFFAISDQLKIGQSSYSGWDDFHDTLFGFIDSTNGKVRVFESSSLDTDDIRIFSEIVACINADVSEQRIIIIHDKI